MVPVGSPDKRNPGRFDRRNHYDMWQSAFARRSQNPVDGRRRSKLAPDPIASASRWFPFNLRHRVLGTTLHQENPASDEVSANRFPVDDGGGETDRFYQHLPQVFSIGRKGHGAETAQRPQYLVCLRLENVVRMRKERSTPRVDDRLSLLGFPAINTLRTCFVPSSKLPSQYRRNL